MVVPICMDDDGFKGFVLLFKFRPSKASQGSVAKMNG